ncbi:MAG: hypothetical protein V1920_05285, partial [Bacillota bacterium]
MPKICKMIKVICPTRIDFTGGFTDVLPFRATQWVNHVNLAIDLVIEVKLKQRNDGLIYIEDKGNSMAVEASSINEIDNRFSLIKAALRKFTVEGNINVIIDSKAPIGVGLGTSGALSVALIVALTTFTNQVLPKY